MPSRVLVTGADGFTGLHFTRLASERGCEVVSLAADLTDSDAVKAEVKEHRFDQVVHLAGISAVTHDNLNEIYQVNLFGTLNLLSALECSKHSIDKVLIASSANVYGNCAESPIAETVCPEPANHYGMSKLSMEKMALALHGSLPLVFVRPFNYTGVGHDDRFVIPKIVNHFVASSPVIELGNMAVEREFNDVRVICQVYLDLLALGQPGEIYNFCSGVTHNLGEVIDTLTSISGHEIEARVNAQYVRNNELQRLMGDPYKLESCLGAVEHTPLPALLEWMFHAASAH